ncbi:Down syndrome cell adhesion molecule-like protein Dscam2 [Cheilinus undulatus]|uniref:Down syndrome cell adhesion molecule-like protein Dscam2 n=1 Tax=Cheilinus undulatus TaxID=241271 RepID=UPI001BD21320|nr:Down syndrome cell adhesion molecule-like protein Dscam2 [Cheilinus undulatus]
MKMKTAVKSSTTTKRGFVSFLLSLTVVQAQSDWRVTYSSSQICAVEGSTVDIPCSYTYPSRRNEHDTVVWRSFWFVKMYGNDPLDLRNHPDYRGRVEYHFHDNSCTLRITNVRQSDSAEYRFMFMTNQPEGGATGSPGVTLSVTDPDLHVRVINTTIFHGLTWRELNCHSRCLLPDRPSYVWYINGRRIITETSFRLSGYLFPADSYTCALKGYESSPSPSVCVEGENCSRVTYTNRSICAFEGSTVDISCTYKNNGAVISKFWFTPHRSQSWRFPSTPEDLREDPQYAGRAQVLEKEGGHSTLRISDLKQSDSAQYHFKFKTQKLQWHNDLPATSLTVTALQVQVTRINWTYYTVVLKCHSSCSPAPHLYIWYKNGGKIQEGTSSFSGYFQHLDSFACALKGYEDFPSPSVCVHGQDCYRVTYNVRNICALKGSSVDISCTYYSYESLQSVFWFSPDRSHQWKRGTEPEDLSKDPQYAGRVQSWRGGWIITLRISELRERDSAQYHFKFKTADFEWGNSFAGTTLTVTALQVKVISVTVHQDYTEAELRCHSSCSPAGGISYTWLKNGQKIPSAENSSHRDRLYPGDFMSCASKGLENYASPSVYALKTPSVWVSPLDEITEGSSVTLTCSSDANPAANYTWYRKNQTLSSEGAQLVFSSIQSSDSAEYQCAAENQLGRRESKPVFIHVQYAPRLPSVSVSPSAEIVEGSSVNLTCSSDANPAANYTWYKENEDSPLASGQIFTITDVRAEHSGNYYCEAKNTRGRHNSTFTLTVVVTAGVKLPIVAGLVAVVLLVIVAVSVLFLIRKKKASKEPPQAAERQNDRQQGEPEEQDELQYASVQFSPNQADLYSNIRPARPIRHTERQDVSEYAAVRFTGNATRTRRPEEDTAALYSTVNKHR